TGDREFLEHVFMKLLLNFTWWVNRKDADGLNVFQGGFLGLDNIGVFDRSKPLPTGGRIQQSDGTSWMGMYCLNMLAIALELPRVLRLMLDESEFLSPYGIRAVSKYHDANPYVVQVDGTEYRVDYEPAESRTGLFGGNSNWRGPIWFPPNFLLIEALQKFHHF